MKENTILDFIVTENDWSAKFTSKGWVKKLYQQSIMSDEKPFTWVNSCSMSLCLASFWVTEVVGAADAAHRLIESFISSSFSSNDWISISIDFHDLLDPRVGEPTSILPGNPLNH